MGNEKLRLFIAIDTPQHVKEALETVREALKETHAEVRWEAAEKHHATIRFLGPTDQGNIKEITHRLGEIAATCSPFSIQYSGLGIFSRGGRPKVIWVGIKSEDGGLRDLHHHIEDAVTALGFEREKREFHPHITLGRINGNRNLNSLQRKMETLTFESQPVTISEFLLVRSDLQSSGSTYSTLNVFHLGPKVQTDRSTS